MTTNKNSNKPHKTAGFNYRYFTQISYRQKADYRRITTDYGTDTTDMDVFSTFLFN